MDSAQARTGHSVSVSHWPVPTCSLSRKSWLDGFCPKCISLTCCTHFPKSWLDGFCPKCISLTCCTHKPKCCRDGCRRLFEQQEVKILQIDCISLTCCRPTAALRAHAPKCCRDGCRRPFLDSCSNPGPNFSGRCIHSLFHLPNTSATSYWNSQMKTLIK